MRHKESSVTCYNQTGLAKNTWVHGKGVQKLNKVSMYTCTLTTKESQSGKPLTATSSHQDMLVSKVV